MSVFPSPPVTALPVGVALDTYLPATAVYAALRPVTGQVQWRIGVAGSGKSADARQLTAALAAQGPVRLVLTEGDLHAELARIEADLPPGQAKNLVLPQAAHDPKAIARAVYSTIDCSAAAGFPMPHALVLDSATSLDWPVAYPSQGMARTRALLGAIARLDLETISDLTGITYTDWTGDPVPDLTGRGLAVVAYGRTRAAGCRPDATGYAPAGFEAGHRAALLDDASTVIVLQRRHEQDGYGPYGADARMTVIRHQGRETHQVVPMRTESDPLAKCLRWRPAT